MRLTVKTLTYLLLGFYVPVAFAQRVTAPFQDGFESGNLGSPWLTGGTSDWQIAAAGAPEGNFFVRSGSISHSQSSFLELRVSLSQTGRVSFLRKVDSEQGFDFLKFFIDGGQAVAEWSGRQDWQAVSFDLTAGNHDLSWIYFKDGSVSSGTDAAFIDNVRVELTGGGVPTLLSPANGATLDNGCNNNQANTIIWDFDWTNVTNATEYNLYVKQQNASTPVINQVTGNSSFHYDSGGGFIADNNLAGWQWKVRAKVNGVWGPGHQFVPSMWSL